MAINIQAVPAGNITVITLRCVSMVLPPTDIVYIVRKCSDVFDERRIAHLPVFWVFVKVPAFSIPDWWDGVLAVAVLYLAVVAILGLGGMCTARRTPPPPEAEAAAGANQA